MDDASSATAASVQGGTAAEHLIARMERLPFTRKHWTIGSVLFSATFFDGYANLMTITVLPMLFVGLGLKATSAGVFLSSAFWGELIGAPLAGVVAEKFGRRNVLLATTVIIGLAAVASALATNLNQLILARAIQGLGLGAEMPVAAAMFSEFVKGRTRGLPVLVWESGFVWGGIVAPWLGLGFIALTGEAIAWRWMFAFCGLAFFIVFCRNNRWFPESPRWLISHGREKEAERVVAGLEDSARRSGHVLKEPTVVPKAQGATVKTNFAELLSPAYRRRTLMVIVWIGMAYLYTYGFGPFVATLYVSIGHMPIADALWLTIAGQVVSIPTTYLNAWLVDIWGRKILYGWGLIYAAVVLGLGALVFGVLGIHEWYVIFAVQVIGGLGTQSSTGFYVYAPELFPTRMRAWATGVGSAAIRAAGAVGPLITAYFLALHGGDRAAAIGPVYLVFALTSLIGGLSVVIFGPETKGQVLEELEVQPAPPRETAARVEPAL